MTVNFRKRFLVYDFYEKGHQMFAKFLKNFTSTNKNIFTEKLY